ncbi:MAG: cache domain-containing protein, partial [Candidatus Cloacimonetes bacterium]|nr:cache domain-containing protein [Candidatus Cloacimonadota bacterium]
MRHICLLMILLTAFSLLGASDGSLAIDESSCQVMLNAAVNYMDSIFMDRLVALQLVANTPEAKKGDWPGIKEYFYSLLMVHPASYFYAQRNGNYYTVEKDFTNLTMKDREFFSTLMEGDPVRGFPVYSRGTGKKSVVVAAPIISNNYAVGALGADIYLDELHNRLNREFDLPEGYTWFVINQEGNTMLDKETEYIFMNTLTQGSPSLISGIKTMLKSQSGKMQYEIGGVVRNAYYKKFPSMNWWMILAKKVENGIEAPPQLNISLKSFIPELQDGLN